MRAQEFHEQLTGKKGCQMYDFKSQLMECEQGNYRRKFPYKIAK
jgi:hypothetical protein